MLLNALTSRSRVAHTVDDVAFALYSVCKKNNPARPGGTNSVELKFFSFFFSFWLLLLRVHRRSVHVRLAVHSLPQGARPRRGDGVGGHAW